jgi:hypothetical protein
VRPDGVLRQVQFGRYLGVGEPGDEQQGNVSFSRRETGPSAVPARRKSTAEVAELAADGADGGGVPGSLGAFGGLREGARCITPTVVRDLRASEGDLALRRLDRSTVATCGVHCPLREGDGRLYVARQECDPAACSGNGRVGYRMVDKRQRPVEPCLGRGEVVGCHGECDEQLEAQGSVDDS